MPAEQDPFRLYAANDASFADCEDTKRSTIGRCLWLGKRDNISSSHRSGLIDWASHSSKNKPDIFNTYDITYDVTYNNNFENTYVTDSKPDDYNCFTTDAYGDAQYKQSDNCYDNVDPVLPSTTPSGYRGYAYSYDKPQDMCTTNGMYFT